MEIIPNVHLITATFVNLYLIVDPDGLTLIDTGIAGAEKKILKYIARRARSTCNTNPGCRSFTLPSFSPLLAA